MRCQAAGVKGPSTVLRTVPLPCKGRGGLGDEAEARALALLLVDDVLRVIDAAAALHVAAEAGVGFLRSRRAAAGRFADLALGDAIADADDQCE